jgi:hypothetical protein
MNLVVPIIPFWHSRNTDLEKEFINVFYVFSAVFHLSVV